MMVALAAAGAMTFVLSRGAAAEAVYPVEKAVRFVSRRVLPWLQGLWSGAEAAAENVRLRREVAALEMVREDNERLAAEIVRYRELVGYAAREPGRWIAAGVLSSGGAAAGMSKTVRVDRGSRAGVVEGAVVAVPEGLVGLVTSVSPHTAEVLLITDPTLKVACRVEGTDARGILSGGTDDLLVLRHLRGGAEIPAQSRVLTSGLGGVFPKGIEVGAFQDMANGDSGVVGEVLPAVDFTALEDVFIRNEK